MGEDTLAADGAGGVWFGGADFAAVASPEIEGEQGSANEMRLAGEKLEGFGDLDGRGEIDGSVKDASGVAGFDRAGGRLGEDAGEAGSWIDGFRIENNGRPFDFVLRASLWVTHFFR